MTLKREAKQLHAGSLPKFSGLHTGPDMTKMATCLATVKQAVVQIGRAEDYLMKGVTTDELKRTAGEIVGYVKIIIFEARKARDIASQMKADVVRYEAELRNALS